jgi:IS4 transposase
MRGKAEGRGQKSKPVRLDGTGTRNIPGSTKVLHLEGTGKAAVEMADLNMLFVPRARVLRKCRLSRPGYGDNVRVSDFKSDPYQQVDADKHEDADMGENGLHLGLTINIAFLRRSGKRPRGP